LSSASFWSDACKYAEGRPLQTLLNAAYASGGLTVSRARASLVALSDCNAIVDHNSTSHVDLQGALIFLF
jgi:hypothetical protein